MKKEISDTIILIVDDSPDDIKALSGLLRPYKKKAALSGKEAIKMSLADDQPDIILLDVLMPGQSGYEVCEELRHHYKTKDIPIIFISAKCEKEDVLRGFEAGGQDYITKPFDARELLERINMQLKLKSQQVAIKSMNEILEQKVRDRTKQLEEANNELQVLAEAKNNFLLMISHELRTPLNGIVAATRLMNDLVIDNFEFSEYMDLLRISVERLERFTLTALTITQLQTNIYKLNRKGFSVDKLVDDCIDLIVYKANQRNIKIKKSISKEVEIQVDRELVRRVFTSVLENSVRFSPENEVILVKATKRKDQVLIEFKDNGSGFSPSALNNLFKPFSYHEIHVDDSLGLSLRAAQLIMKAHDGIIEIENIPEGGALVRLTFIDE